MLKDANNFLQESNMFSKKTVCARTTVAFLYDSATGRRYDRNRTCDFMHGTMIFILILIEKSSHFAFDLDSQSKKWNASWTRTLSNAQSAAGARYLFSCFDRFIRKPNERV